MTEKTLYYDNGTEIRLGDQVRMGERIGRVVLSIDTDEYASDYSRKDWADLLTEGVLILFADIGLVHCLGQNADLYLIARGSGCPDET